MKPLLVTTLQLLSSLLIGKYLASPTLGDGIKGAQYKRKLPYREAGPFGA